MTKVSYLWCAKASESSAISGIRYSQASCKVPPSNRVFTYRDLLTILSSESDCVIGGGQIEVRPYSCAQ